MPLTECERGSLYYFDTCDLPCLCLASEREWGQSQLLHLCSHKGQGDTGEYIPSQEAVASAPATLARLVKYHHCVRPRYASSLLHPHDKSRWLKIKDGRGPSLWAALKWGHARCLPVSYCPASLHALGIAVSRYLFFFHVKMKSINKEEALLFFLIEVLAGRIWFRCLNEVVRYMRLARGVLFFF